MLSKLRKKFDAGAVLTAAGVYAVLVFLGNAGTRGEPFGCSLYFAFLMAGGSPIAAGTLYFLSEAFAFDWRTLLAVTAQILVLSVIYGVFGRKRRLGIASLVFLPASLVPYIFISGAGEYVRRLVFAALATVLAAAFYPAVAAFRVKGLRRTERHEAFSLALIYVVAMAGGIKYMGFNAYKALSVFSVACLAVLFSGKESCLFAFVAAVPAALYGGGPRVFAPYLLVGAASFVFGSGNRFVYALVLVGCELASAYLFGWYGAYGYTDLIWYVGGVLLSLPLPAKLFAKWREALALSSDKPLPRYEINRTRTLVSGKLYEISGTFREISDLFNEMCKGENPFLYEDAITDEIGKVCEGCSFRAKCRAAGFPDREELIRLIAIGKGKGRLTAVDLPRKFGEKCSETGKILFAVNKYINLYAADIERRKAAVQTRSLVALQADGIASALKGMAKTLSKTLSYRTAKERKLASFLLKKGVNVQEVMIFGEGEGTEIHLTLMPPAENAASCVNEFFKAKFSAAETFDLPGGRTVVVFERACRYDCLFGVSRVRKSGEKASGDAHSLVRITRNKFMLALSDGMGSGESARAISNASLSLIECFYRAGLPGEVALSTVNRLLGFAGEDSFAALDLAVVDLENLSCDFIKLGAPYGFIVTSGSVKLIEGSSLPMGILDELKPSVCTEPIVPGDVIVFASDGVTDAFGSATDFADYLSAASVSNPQRLADKILGEAVSLGGVGAADDMTVVALKIFAA